MTDRYRDDPILGPALTYWLGARGESAMPRIRDIDPCSIPLKVLPHLQILDVIGGGERFRYRLIGTDLAQTYGKDYTGTYADELVSGDRLKFIHQVYRAVCETRAPVFSHNRYHTVRRAS